MASLRNENARLLSFLRETFDSSFAEAFESRAARVASSANSSSNDYRGTFLDDKFFDFDGEELDEDF